MIEVLVVEDSPAVRELLVHILNADPKVRVSGYNIPCGRGGRAGGGATSIRARLRRLLGPGQLACSSRAWGKMRQRN